MTIAAVSLLHMLTDPSRVLLHELYEYLYYAPVVASAYWYGAPGGLLAALAASLAYIPHIQTTWADNFPYAASQYAQVLAFHLLGGLVGALMTSQKRLTARYRDAATALEARHRELQESQEHLRRAERLSALGEIAAGLAHELRNPLAGLRGALDIVSSRLQAGTPEAEFAQVARTELERLSRLLDDFLAYARPRPPRLEPAGLQPVVDRVLALLGTEAERRRVRLVADGLAEDSRVAIDAEQIAQVLFNVVLNAIQASPEGGRVTISRSAATSHVTLCVDDEGPGIAPEHVPRIFEPFFTTKHRGTGLGLAVSQRIVAAHGGTIELERRVPTGTSVRIRLPLGTLPAAAPAGAARASYV
jgi:signal transduction histidine kinase